MRTFSFLATVFAATLTLGVSTAVLAQDADLTQDPVARQMLTEQERDQYRERMHNAATPEERHLIQQQYRDMVQERAHQRGTTMRNDNAKTNKGNSSWGQGGGMGGSMGGGQGGGMGGGQGGGQGGGKSK